MTEEEKLQEIAAEIEIGWTHEALMEGLREARELGEKAGRSEKKDSLSTKHLHETE